MTTRHRPVLWATAMLLAGAEPAVTQQLNTITAARQLRGEERFDLRVEFAAGTLRLGPAAEDVLYRMRLTYDDERFEPVHTFDPRSGRAQVGIRGRKHVDWERRDAIRGQALDVYVGSGVPVSLDLVVGAGKADVDLGGLELTRGTIAAGATETEIRWTEPNSGECSELVFKVGAAKFTAKGLGNAGCHRIDVSGGAGEIALDFSGEWERDVAVDLRVALASLDLRFPRDVGIAIESRRLLASLEQPGFASRDGVLYSENWASAEKRVRITAHAALGGLSVGWIGASGNR